ncbi:MAG: helix-turn-helix domain-containing protein [bacterium]
MDDLIRDLELLGFNKKEAAIYISALELGQAGANEIARRADVHRATTYTILDSLAKKGLITAYSKAGERRYIAEPPERLATLFELQQQEFDIRRRLVDNMLLRLRVFHNLSANKPKIRYIESFDGLRVMQREYEQLDDDLLQIIGYDTFLQLHDPGITHMHRRELKKMNRKVKAIIVTERQDIDFSDDDNIEFVAISPTLVPVEGEMTVCGDSLVLFSYTEGMVAIEIKSKTIADTARATLELAWREAKRWGTVCGGPGEPDKERNISGQ